MLRSEPEPEAYVRDHVPVLLLTPGAYGDGEITEQTDGSILLDFPEGQEPEGWLIPEYAELLSASGSVVLRDGAVSECRYTASYLSSGILCSVSCVSTLREPEAELAVFAPDEPEAYVPADDYRIPHLVLYAGGNWNSGRIYWDSTTFIDCEAGGAVVLDSETLKADTDRQVMKASGSRHVYGEKVQSISTESSYRDGVLTITSDGKSSSSKTSLGRALSNTIQAIDAMMPSPEYSAALHLEDAGDVWIIRCESTEERTELMRAATETTLFGQPDLLEQYSSYYEATGCSEVLSVDKDSLLPLAVYTEYSGMHTIDREDFKLELKMEHAFRPLWTGLYYEITEEMPEETEPEEKATPVFYRVTDAQGHEMWLLGTIHVGDARTAYLPQEIYDALEASDALAVECDTQTFKDQLDEDEKLQKLYMDAYMYQDGTKAEDHLEGEEAFAGLRTAMEKYGFRLTYELYPFKVTMWESEITGNYRRLGHALSSECGVDDRLMRLAREQGKELLEVESVQFQMEMSGNFSDLIQQLQLEEALKEGRYAYNASVQRLYERWCRGDEAELREYLAHEIDEDLSDLTPEELEKYQKELEAYQDYNRQMLLDRNAGMLQVVKGYLDSGKTVFVAVGLAHLLGEQGLVDALRAEGYTVELVQYAG